MFTNVMTVSVYTLYKLYICTSRGRKMEVLPEFNLVVVVVVVVHANVK